MARPVGLLCMLLLVGCGSTTEERDERVWDSTSAAFALEVHGGMQGYDEVYSYQRSTATLSYDCQRFCFVGGQLENAPVQRSVQLDATADANLNAQLAAVVVSDDRSRCFSDALEFELRVESSKGLVTYIDDAVAGCANSAAPQRLVSMEAVSQLQNTLSGLIHD